MLGGVGKGGAERGGRVCEVSGRESTEGKGGQQPISIMT
jgi:hypothetical protein